jgi:hypothetical protein
MHGSKGAGCYTKNRGRISFATNRRELFPTKEDARYASYRCRPIRWILPCWLSMNSPRTNYSSPLLMTSKTCLLVDGTGDVYVQCYFLLLTPPAFALLARLKPRGGAEDYAFQPSRNRISRLLIGLTTIHQLFAKERTIFPLITGACREAPFVVAPMIAMLYRMQRFGLHTV